jgi:hypothetical protein
MPQRKARMLLPESPEAQEKLLVLIGFIIFISLAIGDILGHYYDIYITGYDEQKIYNVCSHPYFYPCEELSYAMKYCSSAKSQFDKNNCNVTTYAFAKS